MESDRQADRRDRAAHARRSSPGGPTTHRGRDRRTTSSRRSPSACRRRAEEDVAQRVWASDESLWGGPGVPEIGNRLGWLTIADKMLEHADDLEAFAAQAGGRRAHATRCCSAWAARASRPEVIRRTFGDVPAALAAARARLDRPGRRARRRAQRSTSSTRCSSSRRSRAARSRRCRTSRYFFERAGGDGGAASSRSPTRAARWWSSAQEHGFRRVFLNDPDIGGRYSALSYFGIVPAALAGVDIAALLERAQVAEQRCQPLDQSVDNSGLWLGLRDGRAGAARAATRLTFVVDEPISSFGLWVEQLIAESTGKHGKGILPVADEPLGDAEVLRRRPRVRPPAQRGRARTPSVDAAIEALGEAGPSDDHRRRRRRRRPRPHVLLRRVRHRGGRLGARHQPVRPAERAGGEGQHQQGARRLRQTAAARRRGRRTTRRCGAARPGSSRRNYVAIMGYLEPSRRVRHGGRRAADARSATQHDVATTFGYGPRFLHSTGQFHKGGPPTGVFLQLVHDGDEDVEMPEAGYSFATLKNAQAIGDLQTLREHGLPAERMRLEGDPVAGARAAHREDRGDALMQIGFVGLGQHGRQHGPPDPARLGQRGRRIRLQRGGHEGGGGRRRDAARRRSRTWCRSSTSRAPSG